MTLSDYIECRFQSCQMDTGGSPLNSGKVYCQHSEQNYAQHSLSSSDGQSERTIQILKDMLRACVLDFGGRRIINL